jgi:magnesium chelatase subunit D
LAGRAVVVDVEDGPVRLGLAGSIAAALGADLVRIDDLAAAPLAGVVREARSAA